VADRELFFPPAQDLSRKTCPWQDRVLNATHFKGLRVECYIIIIIIIILQARDAYTFCQRSFFTAVVVYDNKSDKLCLTYPPATARTQIQWNDGNTITGRGTWSINYYVIIIIFRVSINCVTDTRRPSSIVCFPNYLFLRFWLVLGCIYLLFNRCAWCHYTKGYQTLARAYQDGK